MPDQIQAALLNLFARKDRRPIHEWAAEHLRELPPVLTVRSFSVEDSRHFCAPFDALQSEEARQVVIRKPVRSGGTLISDVWHLWARANDPGPAMSIFQSDKVAADHKEHRLGWMLERCPATKLLFSSDRFADSKHEITFADGLPLYVIGPGLNNLQTRGIRYLSISEAWIPAVGAMVEQAEARLGDFKRVQLSKFLLDSQGGTEGDPVDSRFMAGNAAEWNIECASCDHFMPPRWSGVREDGTRWGMRWDKAKDKRGHWRIAECVSTLRFECRKCGHPHLDNPRTRAAWNRSGRFIDTNPAAPPSLRSFTWTGLIIDPWPNLLETFLTSMNAYKQGVIDPLIQFFQKYMGEPKSEASVHEALSEVPVAKYEVQSTWPDERLRLLTVDVQESEFWYVARAWGNHESRRLACGRCYNWAELEVLQKEYGIEDRHVFIDSGFRTKEVYRACCRHGAWMRVGGMSVWCGWHPVKGDPQRAFPHKWNKETVWRSYSEPTNVDAESGTEAGGVRHCQLLRFSDSTLQDRLEQLLKRGLMKSPEKSEGEMDELYRRHLANEFKRLKKNKNTGRSEWQYVSRGPNHLRDCEKLQVLGATLAELLPDAIEEIKT
jgi:phage terminase large subunit GpA